jgi:hypothetical protein
LEEKMINWLKLGALAGQGFLFIGLICGVVNTVHGQDSIDIKVGYQPGQQYHVQSQYQHQGTVIIDQAGGEAEAESLPMEVQARLDYFERFVGSATNIQAVRYYDTSTAKIKIDDGTTESKLAEDNRLVVTRIRSNAGRTIQVASLQDSLKQSELELLQNAVDPLTFAGLLNKQDVKIGTEWSPNRENLANFLAVDRIIHTDVKLLLKDADKDSAKIFIMGAVKAEVDDVMTEEEINGVLLVDLKQEHVSSVRLKITELREPGQVAPGFDGKTKINLKVSTCQNVKQLSSATLAEITKSGKIRRYLKWEPELGNFALNYDPSWKLIASEDEAAILRYLENGDLLAQCNIVSLASRPANKPLSLDDFKNEIVKIIRPDATARVVDASQRQTSKGLKAMQVTVYGEEKGIPLHWIYYNVASPDGRQVTFVFTLEKEIANRVMPAAQKMVDGFVFHAIPKTKKSKAAAHDAKATESSRQRK